LPCSQFVVSFFTLKTFVDDFILIKGYFLTVVKEDEMAGT